MSTVENPQRKNSGIQQQLSKQNSFSEPSSVTALREEGNELFRKAEYTKAIEVFTKALKMDPKNYLLWSNRAAAYISAKQYELAMKDVESCLHYSPPTFLKIYMRKGSALFGMGLFDEALQAYRKGYSDDLTNSTYLSKVSEIEKAKKESADYFHRGAQKLQQGHFADALSWFEKAFQKMPNNAELKAFRSACQGCVDIGRPDGHECLSGTLHTLKRLRLKKRWFSLQHTNFSYFNVNDMTKPPKFVLSLFGAKVTDVQGKEFCLNGPSTSWPRIFRLKADSIEECTKWVNALQGAIASANCKVEVMPSVDMNNVWTPWNTQNKPDREADAQWNGIGLA